MRVLRYHIFMYTLRLLVISFVLPELKSNSNANFAWDCYEKFCPDFAWV